MPGASFMKPSLKRLAMHARKCAASISASKPSARSRWRNCRNCVHDADTVLVLCFDQSWEWARELVKELSRMPDLRGAGKARLLIAGPRDRHAELCGTLGFKTINGIDLDVSGLKELLTAEIVANGHAAGTARNGAAGRSE